MWTLTWGEHEWTDDDLTGTHLTLITFGVGSDTWDIEPTKGPVRLIATLAAFISVAEQRPLSLVLGELSAMKASELMAAISVNEG